MLTSMEKGDFVFCINEASYSDFITKRNQYKIIETKAHEVKIKNDNHKLVWLPSYVFIEDIIPKIEFINIDDIIRNELNDCIEVTIVFDNGERRMIIFMTIKWLDNLFNEHRNAVIGKGIVFVKKVTKKIIEDIINEMDKENRLIEETTKY